MAKKLNVDIEFKANTQEAIKKIKDLNKSILDIVTTPSIKLNDSDVVKARKDVAELHQALLKATDVDTGNINLSSLSKELRNNKKTLTDYANSLKACGEEGSATFLKLSKAIASAEIPTVRLSDKLDKVLITLKNTARWQISSAVLTNLTGSVQTAYYYAKDLNESLNSIRIVTGYSADRMADFAKEANVAAKALSTTTKDYTEASLLFYQMGLDDKEVTERTNTVIKMANVTGQSAKVVSDQMTAIWNNFADGSKTMEYYADVITALGAATASSTDEISQGLEKFAAAAQTVGLSYEYATSALATVTATTRQSADIVGTALSYCRAT